MRKSISLNKWGLRMRVIINNEKIEMAFDEYSGELRELTYLETGENIFKNYIWKRKTPFTLLVCFPNGEKKTLTAPLYDDIAKDYSLKPAISLSEHKTNNYCK